MTHLCKTQKVVSTPQGLLNFSCFSQKEIPVLQLLQFQPDQGLSRLENAKQNADLYSRKIFL
jgi:hypothetical protein